MIFMAAGAEKKAILERVFSGEDLPAARAFAVSRRNNLDAGPGRRASECPFHGDRS